MTRHTRFLLVPLLLLLGGLLPGTVTRADDGFRGQPLSTDGGAPFAAYLGRLQAIHDADWDAFRRFTADHELAGIGNGGGDAAARIEFEESAGFLALMTPVDAEFVKGHGNDRRARLVVKVTRKTSSGAEITTHEQVDMRHDGDGWRLHDTAPHVPE